MAVKEYDVTITEILKKTVRIRAENEAQAEDIAESGWSRSEYILDSSDFHGDVNFHAKEHVRQKEKER